MQINMINKPDSKKNNIRFWVILIILPFLLFTFFEIGLRLFDYGDDLSLFKQATGDKSDYFYINRWVAKRYFSTQGIPDPSNDVFLRIKPENGYRIFVLGGSTAAGWPYSNNIMFSRILQKRLGDAFPNKYIEVVNTSISAINSYTFMDFTDEILDYKPDFILLYGGHNEYYGAFGVASTQTIGNMRWIKKLYLNLIHYKSFQLFKNIYSFLYALINSDANTDQSGVSTLMEDLVNEQSIKYGSELYAQGLNQFEENLNDILDDTKNNGIPVIISELVSNIRDQAPFRSTGRTPTESASSIFKKSQQLFKDNKYSESKRQFYLAKDMDALRFRASEDINELIHEVKSEDGVYLVPLLKYFEEKSINQLIGNDLMLDHLHPNVDGHFILADAYFWTIINNNLISPKKDVKAYKSSDRYRREWGFSLLDSVYAQMKVNI
jgi:lysophospholipase L1-like esterase